MTNFKEQTETKDNNNMSETEKTEPKKPSVVDDNVAILKSKIIGLEALVEELTMKLDDATTKYEQAKEFLDDDAKADLMAYILPRYTMPKELLMLKSVDELKQIKSVLDKVETPKFIAGTPINVDKKPTARSKLASKFDEAQAKRMGGNK